jgi:putative ABC transport system permease protein
MSEAALQLRATVAAPAVSTGRARRAASWVRSRFDDLKLASTALVAHPLRSGLTLLGIVIGVFTVVTMMALTNGLQKAINNGMGGLGADVFQLQKWPALNFGPLDPSIRQRKNLTIQQAIQLRDQLPQAKQVGAEVWEGGKSMTAADGKTANGVQAAGGTAEFFTNNNLPIEKGRGFLENEAMTAARVVVIGAVIADTLFGTENPLGQRVRLGRVDLEVIGVLERQGSGFGGNSGDQVAGIPIGLFSELYGTGRSVNITVMARQGEDLKRLMDQAISAFRRVRGLTNEQENDFDMFSNESVRATFDQMAGTVSMATLCICALSLLVGGIGVMNIMLVAVAERTREIGVRRALGARRSRILIQFVIEAVLLALFGGLVGILMGYGAAGITKFAADLPAEVPAWAVVLGISVSSGIGLLFGIYPAARAARLDPAVALRSE